MPDTKMVKVSEYCSVIKGKIGIKKAVEGEYPLVTTAEERLSHNEYHFDRPSVIIPLVSSTGHGHASLKRIHYQGGKFAVGSILCAVTPKDEKVLNAQFLYHYLDVYKEKLLVSRMRGMANVTLPVSEIEEVEFPLLSTDKQKEWVSLFENTSSYTNSLTSEIDYQQSILKKLRQSILQDAISGKLTEKWRKKNPDVEPATELLARIKEEKERLVKEKKIKAPKPLSPITEDEIPFELPDRWVWCRLGEVLQLTDSGWSPACKNKSAQFNRWGVLKTTSVQNMYYSQEENKELPDELNPKSQYEVKNGDLLITRAGPANRVGICCHVKHTRRKLMISDKIIRFHPFKDYVLSAYLELVLNSKSIKLLMDEKKSGMAQSQVNISQNKFKLILIPLAPTNEQETIYLIVQKFIAYCDGLEQQIGKSQQDSELLMPTVLKEAFEG